jgi:outer membrane immunogenic protein
MKRIVLAAALALSAGPALAADLPAPPPPPRAPAAYVPVAAPIYNWSGIYVGINGGYGFGTSDWTGGGLSTGSFDINGGLVGGTVGVNFQTGQFVFGVEGDADYSMVKGTTTSLICPGCQTSDSWLGTIRGRAGYAWDRALLFVTGGGAYGDIKATVPGVGTDTSTEFGWTVGGGLEYAFTENWTAKVEYLYVDLANGSCNAACGSPATPIDVSFQTSLIRAGINFKFGGF